MNKQQRRDSQLCEEIQMNGEDRDCFGCSCSVCIAQVPNNKYQLMQILSRCEGIDQSLNMMEPSPIQVKLINEMPIVINQLKELLKGN